MKVKIEYTVKVSDLERLAIFDRYSVAASGIGFSDLPASRARKATLAEVQIFFRMYGESNCVLEDIVGNYKKRLEEEG